MTKFIVLAAMKGEFLSHGGNVYENFQMMGYVEAAGPFDAVKSFFDEPHFPIDWRDVRYMWAEPLQDGENTGHYGDFDGYSLRTLRAPSDTLRDWTSWSERAVDRPAFAGAPRGARQTARAITASGGCVPGDCWRSS